MVTLPMGIAYNARVITTRDPRGEYPDRKWEVDRRVAISLQKSDLTVSRPDASWYRKPTSYDAGIAPIVINGTVIGENILSPRAIETAEGGLPFTPVDNPLSMGQFTFNDTQLLRTKLLNNIRSEVLDVGMVLAEMQGTCDTVITSLGRIARSMDALRNRKPESYHFLMHGRRRDNRRPTDKFLRETAGEYLQWKYGVMPSVYDIQGATLALDINTEGSLWNNPPLLVARAVVRKESSVRPIDFGNGYSWPYPIPCRVTTEYKARCDYSVTSEGIRGISRYGLGLSTLPTILFERTPFSFVLNMVLPIAELIKAWTALAGVDVVGYCETAYVKVEPRATKLPGLGSESWQIWSFEDSKGAFNMRREAFDSPPMPLPFVRNPITTGNLGTVLALFTSLRSAT